MRRSKRVILLAVVILIVMVGAAAGAWELRPEARVQRNWHRYHAAIKAHQYPRAMIALQNILQVQPRSTEAYVQLGQTLLSLHDPARAAVAFAEATKLDPGRLDAQAPLGWLFFLAGRFGQARDRAEIILKKDPANRRARLLLAQSALGLGHPDESIHTLEGLVAEAPSSAEAHFDLGSALLAKNATERAAGEFRRAVTLTPKDPRPYYGLALAKRAAKQDTAAAKDFEHALSFNVNLAQALLEIVEIDWARGDRQGAIARVAQQIQRSPNNPQYPELLGFLYLVSGDVGKTRQAWAKAIEDNPRLPSSYMLLGVSYEQSKLHDLAAKKYEDALKADPRSVTAYIALGNIRHVQGQHQQAKEYWEKALVLDPTNGAVLNNLAWYYATDEVDLDKAQQYASRALARAPHDPHVLDTAGWISYKRGRYEEAIRYLSESARALSKDPVIRYHLGMAYLGAGRRGLAKQELTTALAVNQDFPGAAEAKTALKTLQ